MYDSYFNLHAQPFRLCPDPRFFFTSTTHKSALAYLRYGLYQGEGFIIITGDAGTGKTMLVRTLLAEAATEKVVAGELVTTHLDAEDLLRAICAAFGLVQSGSKASLLHGIERFLYARAREGKRVVLLVDEAHNLPPESFEELRMLSNFQVAARTLLQFVLLGQQPLKEALAAAGMAQLQQRVIAAHHLDPLGARETRAYIEHRLRRAGWQRDPWLSEGAYLLLHAASGGIPRVINSLCDRLLLAAALEERHHLQQGEVLAVVRELAGEGAAPRESQRAVEAVLEAAAAADERSPSPPPPPVKPLVQPREAPITPPPVPAEASSSPVSPVSPSASTAHLPPPLSIAKSTQPDHPRRMWPAAGVGMVVVVLLVSLALFDTEEETLAPLVSHDESFGVTSSETVSMPERAIEPAALPAFPDPRVEPAALPFHQEELVIERARATLPALPELTPGEPARESVTETAVPIANNIVDEPPPVAAPPIKKRVAQGGASAPERPPIITARSPSREVQAKPEAEHRSAPPTVLVARTSSAPSRSVAVNTRMPLAQDPVPRPQSATEITVLPKPLASSAGAATDESTAPALSERVASNGSSSREVAVSTRMPLAQDPVPRPQSATEIAVLPKPLESPASVATDESNAPALSETVASTLLTRFSQAYDAGDVARLSAMFSRNARTNDADNRDGILKAYRKLFGVTNARELVFRDMKWEATGDHLRGKGYFGVTVRERGRRDVQSYTGRVEMLMHAKHGDAVITQLMHTYDH